MTRPHGRLTKRYGARRALSELDFEVRWRAFTTVGGAGPSDMAIAGWVRAVVGGDQHSIGPGARWPRAPRHGALAEPRPASSLA